MATSGGDGDERRQWRRAEAVATSGGGGKEGEASEARARAMSEGEGNEDDSCNGVKHEGGGRGSCCGVPPAAFSNALEPRPRAPGQSSALGARVAGGGGSLLAPVERLSARIVLPVRRLKPKCCCGVSPAAVSGVSQPPPSGARAEWRSGCTCRWGTVPSRPWLAGRSGRLARPTAGAGRAQRVCGGRKPPNPWARADKCT